GFLVSTPYAIFDAAAFRDGILAQRRNYFAWSQNQGNLQWYLEYLYRSGLGPTLAVLAGVGLVYWLARAVLTIRRRDFGLQLAFVLPPLLFVPWIASYPSRAERNLIVVLPFLCLAAAAVVHRVCAVVRPPWLGSALLAVCGAAVLASTYPAVRQFNQRLLLPDNRTLALEWIQAHVAHGTRIAREEYTPQVPSQDYPVEYGFSLAHKTYSQYVDERVQIMIASSNVYGRAIEPPYIAGEAGREFYRL